MHISDKPQKSETVLIHAAAGGIGSAAVQPAKAARATELATASAGNIGNVLSQGAEAVFDYQRNLTMPLFKASALRVSSYHFSSVPNLSLIHI